MARRRRPKGRDVQGILLLDKPAGMSSNAALQEVKNLYFAQKAGHTGSLDPLATGLLPICFGQATRVSAFLLEADKQYMVTCQMGIKTTTGDAEGEIIQTRPVTGVDREKLEDLLREKFSGRIQQIPPMYSALKHKGQRLYELARQGIEVEREPRQVTIHHIHLVDLLQDEFVIDVRCSKGTYVRTLVEDIGEVLGVGAHVKKLRRTAVAPFDDPQMYTLDSLRELKEKDLKQLNSLLLPTESALMGFPDIQLNADSAYYIKMGQAVQVPRAPTSGWVRLYNAAGEFLGMGIIQDDGKVAPKRLFS
jgi:tRNA pseudouridine55 synthase